MKKTKRIMVEVEFFDEDCKANSSGINCCHWFVQILDHGESYAKCELFKKRLIKNDNYKRCSQCIKAFGK